MGKNLELLQGIHKLEYEERMKRIQDFCDLTDEDLQVLSGEKRIPVSTAENFIENVVGFFPLPMGVANYVNIDGKDILVPMAVEETSIIAAVSATAKWVRQNGTLRTFVRGNLIIGQIQIPNIRNRERTIEILRDRREELIAISNGMIPGLVKRGGGVKDIVFRRLDHNDGSMAPRNQMLVLHVLCDPCDAMGANLINQVCEGLKPFVEAWTDEKVGMCILSNLVDGKIFAAEVRINDVDPKVGFGIEEATRFAKADPYRAATHNKGVLNGIDPILIATGNDWRAVEAGIHAYAARSGRYHPITDWKMDGPDLVGTLEAPMCVGIVGGVTRLHPTAVVAMKMMKIQSSNELARICAAVGLIQNLGALRALSTVGIVEGHMKLHASNIAIAVGAEAHEIEQVREQLILVLQKERSISFSRARDVLEEIRGRRTLDSALY